MKKSIFFTVFLTFYLLSCSSGISEEIMVADLPLTIEKSVRFDVKVDISNPNDLSSNPSFLTDKGILTLPKGYTSFGTPVKLLIYCHSGGGFVDDVFSESESTGYCKFMSSLGYAVLDMNGIPAKLAMDLKIDKGRTVGNFTAVRSYLEGYNYVKSNFNIEKKGCYLFANSNGGLVAMNLVNLTDIPIIAQAGICPLVSLELNTWNYSAGTLVGQGGEFSAFQCRSNIIRLYGMKDETTQQSLNSAKYEKNKVGNYDPFDYLMNKSLEDYPCPYKIFETKDDWAVNYNLTKLLVDTANKRGGNLVLRTFETGGHTPEPDNRIVSKFIYKAVENTLTPTVLEVGKWFEEHGGCKVVYNPI